MKFPHVHWHKFVTTYKGRYYYECRCGSRIVGCDSASGWKPICKQWLNGGEFPPVGPPKPPPPPGLPPKRQSN